MKRSTNKKEKEEVIGADKETCDLEGNSLEINEKRYYHIFPFGRVLSSSEIIIWGAGEIGREYVQQLERTGYCRIKYIVDINWANMMEKERSIFPPEKIAEETEPTVVIANADVKTAMKIREEVKRLCLKANVVYEDQMCDIPEIKNGYNAFRQLSDSIQEQKRVLQLIPTAISTISLINREVISIESSLKYLNDSEGRTGRWEKHCQEIRKLLHIYGVNGYQLVRVGGRHDGGYIMLDDFEKIRLAYSFGISNDVTWDRDIADKGIDVFMYDHTIAGLPMDHERFHFFRKGIAEVDRVDVQLYSLKTLIYENSHEKEKNMILKMDIEGAEWDVLEGMESDILKMFDQIVLELHNMTDMDDASRVKRILNKLNITHAVVHVHGNNWSSALSYSQGIMPASLEVTYVNRDVYSVKEIEEINLPIMVDERNCCERDEFCLGKWNQIII